MKAGGGGRSQRKGMLTTTLPLAAHSQLDCLCSPAVASGDGAAWPFVPSASIAALADAEAGTWIAVVWRSPNVSRFASLLCAGRATITGDISDPVEIMPGFWVPEEPGSNPVPSDGLTAPTPARRM